MLAFQFDYRSILELIWGLWSSSIEGGFCEIISSIFAVEPSEGAHTEALEVAKDCLAEFFKIDQSSIDTQSNSDSLVDIFSSREESRSSLGNNGVPEAPSSSRGKSAEVSGATQSSVIFFLLRFL